MYFYYGLSLSSFYSPKKNETHELKEKRFLYHKLQYISVVIGLFIGARCVYSYLICLRVLRHNNPYFINKNIWDFACFMVFEFFVVLVLGFSKQNKNINSDKRKESFNKEIFNEFNFQHNIGIKDKDKTEKYYFYNDKADKRDFILNKKDKKMSEEYFYNNDLKEPLMN